MYEGSAERDHRRGSVRWYSCKKRKVFTAVSVCADVRYCCMGQEYNGYSRYMSMRRNVSTELMLGTRCTEAFSMV